MEGEGIHVYVLFIALSQGLESLERVSYKGKVLVLVVLYRHVF